MTPRTLQIVAFTVGALALASCTDLTTEPDKPAVAEPALATATTALAFYQVSGGNEHTCGVTTDDRAYCWGYGLLGDGTTYNQRLRPVAVAGGHRFHQVSAGINHSCGVTTDYRAYCWGANSEGQLGDGTTTDRLSPVPVAGGRKYRQIDAGAFHTCGLSYPDNRAYCWGSNGSAELGDGTVTGRLTPVAVAGNRQFRQVSMGWSHTCAVTPSDEAFCWGNNAKGQVGDGSTVTRRRSPALVAGGFRFRQVDAGFDHTCAVTTTNRAYCWGSGRDGQVGDGKTYLRFTPRAVAGGLSFNRVSTGTFHTCAETTLNRAYCWGSNVYGGLGDGTTTRRLTPVAVVGGLRFSQVSAGSFYTCARTSDAVAYCWGHNIHGELGDGTSTDRPTPGPVAGPM
jgi:alpha-tubulin suppressor-like RCC1 family protein